MKGKEKILRGALDLFTEKGFDGVSIALIIKHSGVSNGAMYHHFNSKEELINQLYLQTREELAEYFTDLFEEATGIREKFYLFWSASIKWAIKNQKKKKYLDMFSHSPYINKIWTNNALKNLGSMVALIEEATKSEVIMDMDINYLICHMKSSNDGVLEYLRIFPQKYSEDFLKYSFKMFWRSIINI